MIIRRANRKNYTTIAKEAVEDVRLSYEALGLLTYLVSRPDDWEVRIEQLRARSLTKIGKDKTYRIVNELKAAGYLTHKRVYEDGKVAYGYWEVREEPEPKREQNSNAEPLLELDPENPEEEEIRLRPENLDLEKPEAGKPGRILNTNRHLKAERDSTTLKKEPLVSESQPSSARKAFQPKWRPIAPDLAEAKQAHADLVEAYRRDAVGGIGAIGISEKAIAALADLPEGDIALCVEACQRWLRSLKAAHKSHTPTIETYVKSREFDHHPRPPGIESLLVPVQPRSWEWCTLFWALIEAANATATGRARSMHRDAKFGRPTHVRNDELPSRIDMERLTKIERNSEEFLAWRRHLGFQPPGLSIWIEGEAFGEWLWAPSRMPPAEEVGMKLGEDNAQGAAA